MSSSPTKTKMTTSTKRVHKWNVLNGFGVAIKQEMPPYNNNNDNDDNVSPSPSGAMATTMNSRWTKEDLDRLAQLVVDACSANQITQDEIFGTKGHQNKKKDGLLWPEIAQHFPYRTIHSVYLKARRLYELKLAVNNGPWNRADVEKLKAFVEVHGTKWTTIGKLLGRTPDSCSEKYRENKSETYRRGRWTEEETDELKELVANNYYCTSAADNVDEESIPWTVISKRMGSRSRLSCLKRWQKIVRDDPLILENYQQLHQQWKLLDQNESQLLDPNESQLSDQNESQLLDQNESQLLDQNESHLPDQNESSSNGMAYVTVPDKIASSCETDGPNPDDNNDDDKALTRKTVEKAMKKILKNSGQGHSGMPVKRLRKAVHKHLGLSKSHKNALKKLLQQTLDSAAAAKVVDAQSKSKKQKKRFVLIDNKRVGLRC